MSRSPIPRVPRDSNAAPAVITTPTPKMAGLPPVGADDDDERREGEPRSALDHGDRHDRDRPDQQHSTREGREHVLCVQDALQPQRPAAEHQLTDELAERGAHREDVGRPRGGRGREADQQEVAGRSAPLRTRGFPHQRRSCSALAAVVGTLTGGPSIGRWCVVRPYAPAQVRQAWSSPLSAV